uniref:hypothetical protein n=1 Tax=Pseudomonas viridiflava TaxID=33069 RepID=UPI0019D088AB
MNARFTIEIRASMSRFTPLVAALATTLLLGVCAASAPTSRANAGTVQVDVPAVAHPAGETPPW